MIQQYRHLDALVDLRVDAFESQKDLLARADNAVRGILPFSIAGTEQTSIGRRNIDWSGRHHAHQEWRAQLNRFFQLHALSDAFIQTSDAKYAQAARDYIEDWIEAHPSKDDWQPAAHDNALNLAIRVGSLWFHGWLGALPGLLSTPTGREVLNGSFLGHVVESIRCQLNWLCDNLTGMGNMRIAEADTLIAAALRLPELPDAGRWLTLGQSVLRECVLRQVLPDGAHVECNPGYHRWMLGVLQAYLQLERSRSDLQLNNGITTELISAMHDYAVAHGRPNGQLSAMHDCLGLNSSAKPDDAIRLRNAFREQAGLPAEQPGTRQHFAHAGQAMLRTAWQPNSDYLTFDATHHVGSHSHRSLNAIQLDVAGEPVLIDPGYLSYEPTDPMMAHGRSTRAHNTVNLNGDNQAPIAVSRFEYGSADDFDFILGEYEGGYWPGRYNWRYEDGIVNGRWARHNRWVLNVQGRYWLVVDAVHRCREPQESKPPTIECNWQFSPGEVLVDELRGTVTAQRGAAGLAMHLVDQPEQTGVSIHEGETDPPRGWISGGDGMLPAPQVCQAAPMRGDYAEYVTVLLPFTDDVPQVDISFTRPDPNVSAQLELLWPDGSLDRTHWSCRVEIPLAGESGGAALEHDHFDQQGRPRSRFVYGCHRKGIST